MSLDVNTLLNDRYIIIKKLGEGTFGETYLAQDNYKQKESVVVKRLMIEDLTAKYLLKAKELFEREAMTLHKLDKYSQTPNLEAHFTEDNNFFLVMEYIAEKNMSELELIEGNKLSENEAIELLSNILEIVDIVHKNDLIHRDIKPDNLIRRTENGKIVLIDFGSVTEELNIKGLIRQGKTMTGNQVYAAPEQLIGESYFSSDIYAVGMIGIQALTGELPSNLRTLDSGEKEWEHLVPDTSQRLKTIIHKMTCYSPSKRYQTAEEVLKDLKLISLKINENLEQYQPTQEVLNPLKKGASKPLLFKKLLFGIISIALGTLAWMWVFRAQKRLFNDPQPLDIVAGTEVSIKGSINTLRQDTQYKSYFEKKFPVTKVNIERKNKDELGTNNGIKLLCAGKINIAAASDFEEGKECPDGKKLFAIKIGIDYLSVVVHKDNPIKGLSKLQVKDIFQCKYVKWNELDSTLSNQEIKVINRPIVSGTNQSFKKLLLAQEEFCQPDSANFKNFSTIENDELVNTTQKFSRGDITYLGFGLAIIQRKTFKILPIDGVSPGEEDYPYTRSLFYVYKGEKAEKPESHIVKQFLGFVQHQIDK